ncbi:A24 family peptidase [Corynebacterium felinum]|uniref:Prepilin signal peptidase PulO-like enzyme (Type II secretory pathway) n=1 Tax=Corynebacterium felinum TaxID=131318 RepID=A0ABU2BAZ3_9CORY|nr:A24 family peptidase [Corynebacterium felinum]MDF5821935.1 A24 family peptidase [Corynebacterium felinum]MDR7355773.1 prepilin signal peptidase PulO-like enzyme (type II secretory pathway) [Corynebacterium felinum]WJY95119.1 Type IV leader peptidase family protein [Corynebacterium felinum]
MMWVGFGYAVAIIWALALSYYDFRYLRLPNFLTLPAIPVAALFIHPWWPGVVWFLFYLLFNLTLMFFDPRRGRSAKTHAAVSVDDDCGSSQQLPLSGEEPDSSGVSSECRRLTQAGGIKPRMRPMGMGDVKLAFPAGVIAGESVFIAILVAQILTILGAVISRRSRVPHGPAMLLAAFGCHFWWGA